MMDKYLIVTDLDGTLLNSKHNISDFNIQQINQFRKYNGQFTIATGRTNKSVEPYIKKLNIRLPIITYNGGQIYCPVKKQVLYHRTLPITEELCDYLKAAVTFSEVVFFAQEQIYTINRGDVCRDFEQKENLTTIEINWNELPKQVTKIMLMSKARKDLENFATTLTDKFNTLTLVFSQMEYLEILPVATSKGEALKELINLCQLTDAYTIGFGDNFNDIPLLTASDLGIAVSNAEPQLKKVADHTSQYTNDQDAVGHYIQGLLK